MILSLIAFVSVVWLKDQLGQGIGRNWFDQDQNVNRDRLEPNNLQDEEELPDENQENQENAVNAMASPYSQQMRSSIYLQSQVNSLSEEQWKTRNTNMLEFFSLEVEKMRELNMNILEYRDLLLLSRTMAYEKAQGYEVSMDDEVNAY